MIAGLPGLALSGLFFTLCALAMPFVELGRTVRGQGSRERWGRVLAEFGLAVAMVGVYVALGALLGRLLGSGAPAASAGTTVLEGVRRVAPTTSGGSALAPLVVTAGLLAAVLVGVRLARVVAARAERRR